jgi:predicted Zn-dependent peptidase
MHSVQKEVLPNGLTVITEAMPAIRSVAIGVWLKVGSRHERESENGITHFLEHMVFKGTTHRTAEEIARSADSIGGHLDAFTAKEFTCFSVKVLDEHVPRAFDVLADLVKNPLFEPGDVAKESQVIQEEIKMVEDTPDDLVHEIFTEAYWRGHALARPILGTRQTVRSFDRPLLVDYFQRHYTPRNMVIAAAGNLRHESIVEMVGKEFGDIRLGPAPEADLHPVAHATIRHRHKKNLEQAHICLGAPSYPQTDPRRFAVFVLNTVLGGGMSSRLFQNIREQRGLAYAVFSGLSTFSDAGCLSIYAGTARENVKQVVALVVEELHRLKQQPLTPDELQRAKDYLKGSMLLGLESSPSRMTNVARQEIYFGRYITLDEVAQKVDAVTSEDVQQVAHELFDPARIALTVLGPPQSGHLTRADLEC